MHDEYKDIKELVEAAGFFTTEPPDCLVCASACIPDGGGLTGISFRVFKDKDGWKLILWNPKCYLIPDQNRVVECCLAWLSLRAPSLPYDLPDKIKEEFGLVSTSLPAIFDPR